MKQKSTLDLKCHACDHSIPPDRIYGQTVICANCNHAQTLAPDPVGKSLVLPMIFVGILVAVGIGAYFKFSNEPIFTSEEGALAYLEKCDRTSNLDCRLHAYKSLVELDPENVIYQANHAFTLTKLNSHEEALPIYEKLIAQGEGTYDLMAFYGTTLEKLGRTEDAMKWFKNALSINPRLMDTTKDLALLLNRMGQPEQAASLMESFVERFPQSAGYLKGSILSILESNETKDWETSGKEAKSMILLGLADSHHFIPLRGAGTKSILFMVDTGASTVAMSEKDFKTLFPGFSGKISKARFSLADGRVVDGNIAVVPSMRVGPWELKNIEVSYCKFCEALAGKSLLKNFKMTTTQKGELETMELRRSR